MPREQEGQVVQYIDGYAWGIAPTGETICLGTEVDIRTILVNPRKHPSNPTIAQIISLERQLLKQEDKKDIKEREKAKEEKEERHKLAEEFGVARKIGKPRKNKNRA